MSKRFLAILTISRLAFVVTLSAENWPAWRGPLANGLSGEKGLPLEVVDDGERRLEAVDAQSQRRDAHRLERSHLPERRDGDDERRSVTVGRRSQERRADLEVAARRRQRQLQKQNMSSPSPVTDGTTVWVMTGTGILKAFDFKGTELWTRDIQKDYGAFRAELGLRIVASPSSGMLTSRSARDEDRRPVLRHEGGRQVRQDALESQPADSRNPGIA